jgi:hypothetical protein
MIIKRTMKLEMPNLKRCKLEDSDWEEEEGCGYAYSVNPKKRKPNEYRSVGNSGVEGFSNGSGYSWWSESEESCWDGELESNSKQLNEKRTLKRSSERFRPALLKSSRGRIQMLPSRLYDSVVEIWKTENSKFNNKDSSLEGDAMEVEDMGFDQKSEDDKSRFKNSSSSKGEVGCVSYKKYLNSSSSKATTFRVNSSALIGSEAHKSRFSSIGIGRMAKENSHKRKEVYKPEDFALGDIVWAKCGRRYPAWPAIVIDPILQAPETVLRCCVPGAICVMFFGYSKNGTQRVKVLSSFLAMIFFWGIFWVLSELCWAGLCVGEAGNDISLHGIHGQVRS